MYFSRILPIQSLMLAATLLPMSSFALPLSSNFVNLLKGYGAEIFGEPSAAVGEMLSKYERIEGGPHPEEIGAYFQGDILFPMSMVQGRNGLKAESAHWEAAVVPYQIANGFSSKDRDMLKQAMEEYHKKTCIRFTEKTSDDTDYIYITNESSGCWSSVGRVGGKQQVNLQSPGCLTQLGTPVHELMHALGFFHEQNRYERDDYVTINYANIQNGKENNFKKVSKDDTSGFGVTYDYGSVMHYSAKAFSKNDKETIKAKKNGVTMGQRKGLSTGDIKKLNAMYKCDSNGKSKLNK